MPTERLVTVTPIAKAYSHKEGFKPVNPGPFQSHLFTRAKLGTMGYELMYCNNMTIMGIYTNSIKAFSVKIETKTPTTTLLIQAESTITSVLSNNIKMVTSEHEFRIYSNGRLPLTLKPPYDENISILIFYDQVNAFPNDFEYSTSKTVQGHRLEITDAFRLSDEIIAETNKLVNCFQSQNRDPLHYEYYGKNIFELCKRRIK